MVDIRRESPDQSDVVRFLAMADTRSSALYLTDDRSGLSLTGLLIRNARFFVARANKRALGCGGYVVLKNGAAEIKRLFVDPAARRQGVGARLVLAIEAAALREGIHRIFLETGVKSFEAMRLYERLGFEKCAPFEGYFPDQLSIFMVKSLP